MTKIQISGIALCEGSHGETATLPELDWITNAQADAVSGMVSFQVDGVDLSAIASLGSLVPDVMKIAIENARTWPEAKTTVAKCNSQIVVAGSQRNAGHEDALLTSKAISRILAEYLTVRAGLAVYWPSSGVLAPAELLIEAIKDPDELSIGLVGTWVRLQWFRAPGNDGKADQLAVSTQGLAHFIGYEIDFEPSDLDAVKIAERLLYTARYLIQSGPVLADGDTIGEQENAMLQVQVVENGYSGKPAYRLRLIA